jgi:hypothetical protein
VDVPKISQFYGITILMNYNDHAPPHFHARYGGQKALIAIDPVGLLAGRLSRRAMGFVFEWAELHREELMRNWELARNESPLRDVRPLE